MDGEQGEAAICRKKSGPARCQPHLPGGGARVRRGRSSRVGVKPSSLWSAGLCLRLAWPVDTFLLPTALGWGGGYLPQSPVVLLLLSGGTSLVIQVSAQCPSAGRCPERWV